VVIFSAVADDIEQDQRLGFEQAHQQSIHCLFF
jgi:hypothetical protein